VAAAVDGVLTVVLFPPGDGVASEPAPVPAATPGAGTAAGQLGRLGAAEVCLVAAAGLAGYVPAGWARVLQQLAGESETVAVVAAGTDRGHEVLAHLGAMMDLPVAANCLSARPAETQPGPPGRWQLVRQRWAGSLLEDAVLAAPCALLTVADALTVPADGVTVPADALTVSADLASVPADGAAVPGAAGQAASVRIYRAELTGPDLAVRAIESEGRSAGMSLATARVVVGGGRGVGGPDGFAALEELAGLLGGVVGVSRVVTSQGWRPHRQQVGQTGTKISPELYLACGISGAIQHMAGCLTARNIVAVNTDPDAPIIAHADYAVIGDLSQVIPALVAAIRARSEP
jgi:electron transfer flavoprotein alpha subunit